MSRIIKVITEEENIQPPYLYIVKKKSYKTHLLKISFSVKKIGSAKLRQGTRPFLLRITISARTETPPFPEQDQEITLQMT